MTTTVPYLDAGLQGWIFNFARQNFWRVQRWMDLEDLVQDGMLCYAKCLKSYGETIDASEKPESEKRRWFMRLVQTAFRNRITDLAEERRDGYEEPISQLAQMGEATAAAWERLLPSVEEEATLATMLAQAPKEVRQLVELLRSGAASDVAYLKTRLRKERVGGTVRIRRGRRHTRETNNEHYCRLLGLDPERIDLLEMAEAYFAAT